MARPVPAGADHRGHGRRRVLTSVMAGEQDGSAQRVLRHAVLFGFAFTATDTRAPTSRPPDHVAFADWVGPLVENVTVVDYWARRTHQRGG